ncbi:MAG TPA: (d)CMP kinase [Chthoniobacteraceae bacterium]|jgi:cytidylate kinase|nr:(d)CMP kinase [Chthoniobacteraceae bacterium]
MNNRGIVIAIDGPAASGKSTVARTLARRLGLAYVNSGAMYRAVTWWMVRQGIDPNDAAAVIVNLPRMRMECGLDAGVSTIRIDGENPEPHLTDDIVNENVSAIARIPEVRRILVEKQRAFEARGDLVMEGRDIGSVVFPDTPYKFYVDASPDIRARRRALQGQRDAITDRDRADTSRKASPLTIAEDAHVIDSSNLTIDGVVGEIIGRLKLKGLEAPE